MKAVILAAGKGTRMGPLTHDIPKPMIPVAGKPVVEHIMRGLILAGVSEFILVTRYLAEKIEENFGDGQSLGARIDYLKQTDKYGTGAALLTAKDLAQGGPVLMTYGDIITSPRNYSGAIEVFTGGNCQGVMTLNWMEDPWAGGAVHVDERERITAVVEKPPKGQVTSHWNSAGIFVFEPIIFDYLERLTPSPRGEYELPDALNAMIADGLTLRPYYLQGPWRDVGTIEDIAAAEEILRSEGASVDTVE